MCENLQIVTLLRCHSTTASATVRSRTMAKLGSPLHSVLEAADFTRWLPCLQSPRKSELPGFARCDYSLAVNSARLIFPWNACRGFEVTREDITEEWQLCKQFFSPKKIASASQYHVLKLTRKRNQQLAREAESNAGSMEQCGGSESAHGCRSRESSIDVWSCDGDDNDNNQEQGCS